MTKNATLEKLVLIIMHFLRPFVKMLCANVHENH